MTRSRGVSRMFVAVQPPDEAVEHLDEFLDVRREAADFRWATTEQMHVTLAFLAAVPERRVDDLVERLARAATRRTAFDTRIAGGGAFPGPVDARVLWAGLELDEHGRTELARLATGARAAAARAGIEVSGGRFRPHVTVARLRRPAEATRWVRLLEGYAGPPWRADRIELVESFLGQGPRGRPRYETVDTFPLTSP
ncbi:RNA 2',3'-cyclic phosphodiesterase [Nocardioides dilutus]